MALIGKWFGFGRDEIFEEALRSHERGDHEATIEALEAFLEMRPTPDAEWLAKFYLADALANLSQRYSEAGQPELALEPLERAILLAPAYPDYRMQAAMIYRDLGRPLDEAKAVECALRLNPSFRGAILYEIAMRYRDGDAAWAMARLALALERDPDLDCERLRFARQAHEWGDSARALANLEAVALRPDSDVQLHMRLGDSFLRGHLFDEAASEFEKAIALEPSYADVRCRYGRALLGAGRTTEAISQFRAALSLNDRYSEARLQLDLALRMISAELSPERRAG